MLKTVAFVMDPLENVQIAGDTSFAFMMEAQRQGYRVVHVHPHNVGLEHDRVFVSGTHVELKAVQGEHFRVVEPVRLGADECQGIFIRTDPPFNEAYLTTTWLLSFAEARGVRVINSPRGLREANEHLYSLKFPEFCPRTLIASQRHEVRAFVESVGGQAIAKPIDGHAGFGVVRLVTGDSNFNALIDMLTIEGRQPVMVQEFVNDDKPGDKRLFFVNGELRGSVRRVPAQGDHRGNIHVGGYAEACELTDDDRRLAERIGPKLREDGLLFAGLDVIGNKLIEVNVTSPTLIVELKKLGGPDLAKEVIDLL